MNALTQSNDTAQAPGISDFAPADPDLQTTKSNVKYGPWALVTGASAGIGREFVRQLAADGLNLVLASRNRERLEALAEELTHRYGVAIRTVPVDLSNTGSTEVLEEATADLEIGLLVNNAGVETHGAFLKSDLDRENALLQLNVVRPMELAHVFGQKMARRGRGGILFVSSTLAYQPVPYFANYASSKAYILSLGEALHFELKKKGVDVTVLSPGLTDTAMAGDMDGVDFGKTPIPLMDVEPVVRTAIRNLGRRPSVIPGAINNIMGFLGKRVFSRSGMARVFSGIAHKAMQPELL